MSTQNQPPIDRDKLTPEECEKLDAALQTLTEALNGLATVRAAMEEAQASKDPREMEEARKFAAPNLDEIARVTATAQKTIEELRAAIKAREHAGQ